jgi:hypothetical protein
VVGFSSRNGSARPPVAKNGRSEPSPVCTTALHDDNGWSYAEAERWLLEQARSPLGVTPRS